MVMPIQPNDRYQQDPERLWRAAEAAGGVPGPAALPGRPVGRGGALPWAGLDKLSVGTSSARRLLTHHRAASPRS